MAFNYLEDLKKRTTEKTAQPKPQQTSTTSGSASYDYLEGIERKRMTPQPGYNKGTMKSNINPDSPRPGGVSATIAQTKGKETNYGITRKDDLASASAKYKAAAPDWKPEDDKVPSGVGAALFGSVMNIYDFPSSLADWAMGTLANTKNRFKNIDLSGKQDSIVGKYAGGGIVRSQQESYDAANPDNPGALSRKAQGQQEAAILRRADPNDTSAMAEARRNIEKAQKGIDTVTDLENESQLVQYIGQGIQSLPTTLASRLGPAGMVLSSIASFKRSYDQKYDEMEASGKEIDPDKLMTYSIAAAAVEVGSEYIFPAGKSAAKVGYGVLKNTAADNVFANGVKAAAKWLAKDGDEIIVPTLKAFGKSLLKESGQEGAEEVVSYVGQGILAKLLTNQDDEWSSLINTSGAFQSFMGGAVAGLMFSGVAATPGFIQSRQWLKQNSNVPINKLTDDQIRDLFKRAREDYETAEGRQDLNGGLLRTVAKAQSTGQVVQEAQSGQAFEVLQPGPNGEVTLLGMDGGTDMALPAADLQASLENGLLVEVQQPTATPATAVMTDSSLPVTSGQAAPAGVAQAAPVAMTDVTLPGGKTRREVRLTAGGASVRAYQDKSNLIVKIRAGKMMTDETLTIGLDEIAQSENLALALETGSNGQLSRIIKNSISPADSAAFVQGISQAASAVAADAQQAEAQADAEQQAKVEAEQKTEAFRQESEAEAKEIQRMAELGLVAEETASSIAAVNADLARLNIQGRMRPVRLENHTAVMTDIQNIMQEVAGKQIIFVESVGDDRVNEFVNDFSKDTVFVNIKQRKLDDALFAVGHGLHHLMVKDGNGVLFTQTAMKYIPQSEIDTYINGFESEAYRQRLQDSPALVAEELVGDRAGELFKSPKWWKTMAELAPSKKRANIMNQIAAHLEAMGAASETISDDEITAMTEALKAYQPAAPTPSAKAQTTETVNQETKQQTSPDVPKSFMMGKTVQTSVRPNEYIDVQYAIVDVSQLIASHDIAGNENPDYNQDMQPRDRSRVSSQLSIAEIVNKIDPKQLVGNETAKNGAPIVGKDGMVESGNSRIIALQESYRLKNSSANKYRDYIEQNAQEYGIFGSLPANPVLIRVRLTDTDRAEFARLANVSEQAIMSASEQAQSDAKRITNGLLEMFDINANGEINTAANRDFIRRFVADIIPAAERGSVLQDNGQISATGILRIKNAVFFKAYENVNLLEVVSESTDNNIKNIINSMIQIAPLVVKTKAGIERGVLYDMDISGDMAKAVEKYDNLRLTAVAGMDPVESYVKQVKLIPDENMTPVAENLLKVLYLYKGSRKKLISFFADFYNGIDSLGSPQDQNLFGDVYQPNRDAYIDTVIEKELDKYAKAAQSEGSTDPLPLFEYAETAARAESVSDQTAGTEARTEPGPAAPEVKRPGLSLPTTPAAKAAKAKAAATKSKTKQQTGEITDFGEKIGGARKDAWRLRGLIAGDLDNMNDMEAGKYVKKDNVWKKADYKQMRQDGIPVDVVYFIKQVRDAVPVSPKYRYTDKEPEQLRYRREQYIEFVRNVYQVMSQVKTKADALKAYEKLLLEPGYIQKGKSRPWEFTDKANSDLLMTADLANTLLVREDNWDRKVVREMNKRQFLVEAENKLSKGIEIVLETGRYFTSKDGRDYTGTYSVQRGSLIIQMGFASEADALEYVKQRYGDKGRSKDGKQRFIPRQLQTIHRTGKNYRDNDTKDVTGDDYLKSFGFRGGEFGNWVNQEERQISLNYGFDALHDLADALNIDPQDISLNGKLAIAFGARGQGSALAHFEPEREVINLTKMKGAGSLAHEWGHALDFILGKALGAKSSMLENLRGVGLKSLEKLVLDMKQSPMSSDAAAAAKARDIKRKKDNVEYLIKRSFGYYANKMTEAQKLKLDTLTEKFLSGTAENATSFDFNEGAIKELSDLHKDISGKIINKDYRQELSNSYGSLVRTLENIKDQRMGKSEFLVNSEKFDNNYAKETNAGYWSSTEEMFARSFACYVTDKLKAQDGFSDYLSGHSDSVVGFDKNTDDELIVIAAFPQGEERKRINADFDALIAELKEKGLLHDPKRSEKTWTNTSYSMRTNEHLGNRNIEKYMSEESQKQLQDYAKVYVPQSNQRTYKNVLDMLTNDYQQTMADAEDVNQASAELTHIRQMLWVLADARQDYVETNRWFYLFNKANEKAGQAVQANVMIDNMALQGNLSYAMQSFDESISKGKKAAVKAATINLAKKFNEIDRAAAPEAVPNQAELQDELGAQIDEAKRKERALKRILGRLDALENKVGEFDADAVSQYIKTLHGVAAVTQNVESLPKTSDPKAFMQYVVKNIDTLQNEWLAAYRIIRNLHGMDEVFMAEIDAYFGDFIPDRRYQHPLPALELTPENYDQIKNAVVAHYSEDFRTFDAMVYELRKLGLDMQNAVLVARMAQKQLAALTREQKLMAARKILKAGSKTKEEILNKIINLSNERGIDDQTVQAFIAKTFKLPGLTPELYDLISRNSKTLADLKKNMLDDGRTYMTEQEKRYASILKAEILAAVQREKKSTWLQKVDLTESISLMSNPKTINRNIVGNFGFATIDLGKDYVAAGIDYAISKGTGRRYIPKPVLLKMFKGFKRGAVEAWEDIWKYSIDTSNLDTGWSVPRGDVFTSKFGRTVMKVFRTVMQLPDRAFQAAAFDSQLAGLMKLYDVADVNDVTPEMLEAAQYYASYKTFTDENYLNTSLGKIKSILNFGKAWGIGSIVFKFTHVPASLTMRAIEYSPVSLFKAAYYLARPMAEAKAYGGYGNAFSEKYQRKFANALAEGTFGSLVTIGLGAWLTSLGLMTGRPEDDEDKRKLNRAIGMGRGYMMNWSGLWRVLRTLDPDQAKPQYNDLWSTYSWFSPMNIGISIGANITQDMRKFENDGGSRFDYFTRAGWTSVTSAVESITEMSVLAGLNNFIYNMTNAPDTEKNFLTAMMKTAASVPSNFVPQVVKGLRDLNDNTMRELGSSSDFLQYAINSILNKVPGASKLLPPAESDALGNLREVYEENGNNIWNVFFNPAIMSRYTPNSSALMVLNTMVQMEQQGLEKTNMIPQEVYRNFGYKEIGPTVELTLQEQYDLTSAIRKEVMRRYATIPSQLTLEDKVDRMTKILNEVTKTYKSDMQRKKLKAKGIRPKN